MSHDRPDIPEILVTLKEFTRGVADKTQGSERYDALCAGFLVDVVKRELACVEAQDKSQAQRLTAITGQSGEIEQLYEAFCHSVRGGRLDQQWDQVFDFALQQVIDKVAVTKPDYLLPEHQVDTLAGNVKK